jgi:hypothetical protein
LTSFPCALVANTDRSGQKGEHWVAFFVKDNNCVEYFDSFGMPPLNCDLFGFFQNVSKSKHLFNDVQLQGISSTVCGHYCIAFLARRCRGQSMFDIVHNFFKGSKPGSNDSKVKQLVCGSYDIPPPSSILPLPIASGSGFNSSAEINQCCCALKNCNRLCDCIKSVACCV